MRSYRPTAGKFSILWILSHPSTLTQEELDSYDLIYAASETLVFLLSLSISKPVKVFRQCTDTTIFYPGAADISRRSGILYVANTRGIRRNMAWWGSQAIPDLQLYGQGWDSYGMEKYVKGNAVANDELPGLYRAARLSLNDHWLDMRHFGIINNRIFDCLACGLPVITDSFPELRHLLGDALLYADTQEEFETALRYAESHFAEVCGKTEEFWKRSGHLYSFDARAQQILEDIALYSSGRGRIMPRQIAGQDSMSASRLWQAIKENARCDEYQIKSIERISRKQHKALEKYKSRTGLLEKRIKLMEGRIFWVLARRVRAFIRRLLR
jgi:glycosyltransferase involved in cell wall biosynthesis